MEAKIFLSDDELRALGDWTPLGEGEGVGFLEASGELAGGFPDALRDVAAAAGGEARRLPGPERVLFLCRAFYFLGVLRGGEAYRDSLGCDAEAELPEPLPFELDDFSAADFADGLLELKPEDRDKLLELLGLRIANGGGAVEAVRVVSESDTEFPDFEEEER